MNCIVIDDDKAQRKLVCNYIKETDSLTLLKYFENPTLVLKELSELDIDIIFLDVEMPQMNGIEFLEKSKPVAEVILLSSSRKYATDGFDYDVADFLLKPISYARFLKSLNKVQKRIQSMAESADSDYLFVKSNGALIKLFFSDLLWIKSANEYIVIYTTDNKYMVYSSMADILSKLPNKFMRVHRSNIVSLDRVEGISGNEVLIQGTKVKISKTYKANLIKKLGL